MTDAVARYRAASAANDIESLMGTFAPDVELLSPLSGRMVFRGKPDLRVLLAGIYGSLTGLRWGEEVGDEKLRVAIAEARVGPVGLGDAMVFELGEDGLIRRIRPHLRPWLGLTVLAMVLLPKVARHPALVLRALRLPGSLVFMGSRRSHSQRPPQQP